MLIDGNRVYLEKWQIEEVLEKRLSQTKESNLDNFFIVMPSPNNYEWDTHIECKYGRLRTFLVDPRKLSSPEGRPGARILILHKSLFKYPEISPFNNYINKDEIIN